MEKTSLNVIDRYNKILGRIIYDPETQEFTTTNTVAANTLKGFEKPGLRGEALFLKISGWSNGYMSIVPVES